MEAISTLGLLLGTSFTSGIRLYGTIAGLGIAQKMEWIELPGNLDVLSHPMVIGIAVVLYVGEFLADKFPLIDSAIDSVNTFIRPLGGGVLSYMAMGDANPAVQMAAGLLGGGVALTTHGVKATGRMAINTSPEPVSNVVTSTAEDGLLFGGLWLIITNPVVMAVLVVLFLIFAVWFLRKMARFFKSIFRYFKSKPAIRNT